MLRYIIGLCMMVVTLSSYADTCPNLIYASKFDNKIWQLAGIESLSSQNRFYLAKWDNESGTITCYYRTSLGEQFTLTSNNTHPDPNWLNATCMGSNVQECSFNSKG